MRIAEKRNAVRIKRQDLLDGLRQRFQRLVRQTIKKVAIDRMYAPRPDRIDDGPGLLESLDAVDRLLNLSLKILYTEARRVMPMSASAS